MPWHVSKTSQCPVSKPWGVILEATGKVIKGGCHPTEEKAKEHMAALYANEPSDSISDEDIMTFILTLLELNPEEFLL